MRKPFLVGMMLTLVLIAVGAWATWSSYDTTRELAGRQMRLVALKGVVTQLDEVLTMSARMAAATGDLVWEERYRRYEPELDAAIKEMLEVATVRIERFCARTDTANQALVAMENRAFERVRAGSREEASSILFGGVYEEQKKIYAAGMAATMSSIESAMDDALDAHGTRVSVGVVVASVLLAVSLFAWARNAWQLRARSARLAEALERSERDHAALAEAHQQLEKFHRELVAREKLSSLGLLAAGVAHEINNPMAFITMNVQTLIEDLRDVPPEQLPDALRVYADELLPSTIDGIQRVNTIVRDLQQFARGDIDTQCEFDLNAEIAAAARISSNQLKGRARLALSLGELPPLHGKPRQLTQVMVNLIVNAAHAVAERPAGSISVTSRCDVNRVVVEVRDNGCGMSRDVMARMFQPFFTTKTVGQGTGLGLSVAYGIIRDHDGQITVDSEIGKGTCIRVELPVRAADEQVARAA